MPHLEVHLRGSVVGGSLKSSPGRVWRVLLAWWLALVAVVLDVVKSRFELVNPFFHEGLG